MPFHPEESYLSKLLAKHVRRVKDSQEALGKQMGTLREPVPPEEQMRDYENLTAEGLMALTGKYGYQEINRYVKDMEKRRKLSQSSKSL